MCLQFQPSMMSMPGMQSFAPLCPCCSTNMMPMAGGMFPIPTLSAIAPEEIQKQQLKFQHQQLTQMKINIRALAESIEKSMSDIEIELEKIEGTKAKKSK